MREAALAYARAGEAVLPLVVGDKDPVTSHGLHDASADPERVARWWQRCPNYNVGIRPSLGTIVLDVDPRHGGTLESLGALPPTRIARTGGGGWHLWFHYRGAVRREVAGVPGVDIKANSGYVVVPPSVHESGRRYEWVDRSPVAMLPPHLRGRVARPSAPPRKVTSLPRSPDGWVAGLVRTVADAVEGNRNRALYWATCRVVERGADPAVLAILHAAAATAGLGESEIERTMTSAERRRA